MTKPAKPEIHKLVSEFTVYYSVQVPEKEHADPPALLIALHGFGQNCQRILRDLVPLRERNILIVAPQGPDQFYLDLMGGEKVGFNWLTSYDKATRIADVNAYLARAVEKAGEHGTFDRNRIFILGFSQGVSMAWRFAVSGLVHPAGVIGCCADLAPDVAEKLPGLTPFPALLVHGENDDLFPKAKMEQAVQVLEQQGYPHEVYLHHEGHTIPRDAAERIGAWIEAQGNAES